VSAGTGGVPSADAAIDDAQSSRDAAMIEPPTENCLAQIFDYKSPGPFDYETISSGSVKIWKPAVPSGCQVPIVHFANGLHLACGNNEPVLAHLASHGFLALCYESPQTGDGTQCIEAVELALEQYPDLVSDKIGFAGHCQGGVSAILCAYRAEERWPEHTLAVQAGAPEHGSFGSVEDWTELYGEIESPVFMFNGSEDLLASAQLVGQGLDHLSAETEVTWYEAIGATHVPVPNQWIQESAVAWFRWKLLDDRAACAYWKAMPEGDAWDMKAETNPAPCE
jgi:dienelactone hydrolase